jgi:hypothetical protein
MSLTRWLSRPLDLSHRPASPRKTSVTRYTFRPNLEALEDRCVPSTLTVTSIADKGAGSLRADIAAAQDGDTIVFAPGLVGKTITLNSEFLINKNLNIAGPGAGQLTVSGNNGSRVFEVAQGMQVTLSGLTISKGFATNGAGILVDTGAVLALSDSTLSSNSASKSQKYVGNFGGGIDNYGTATVSNCTLTNNTSLGGGGGIYNHATLTVNNNSIVSGNSDVGIANLGMATISGSTLSGNSNAAVYNFGGATVTVDDCLVSGNTSDYGGGIFNGGAATLSNSTLSGNVASTYGGGVYSSGRSGTLNMSGCTLFGNSSTFNSGGGIYISAGKATISNCTLSDNSAANYGGGISISLFGGLGATLTITGSTLTGNSARDGGGIYIGSGGTVYLDAFTVANLLNNTDATGLNGPTANLDGSYTVI